MKYICDIRDFSSHPDAALFVQQHRRRSSATRRSPPWWRPSAALKPAYFYVKSALESGRHVVTSNKELVATHGAELLALARAHKRVLPVRGQRGRRHAHHHAHAPMPGGQRHQRDRGHRQRHHQLHAHRKWRGRTWIFDEALKLAQSLGYAETIDPVGGRGRHRRLPQDLHSGQPRLRAACSIPQNVPTRGIRDVTREGHRAGAAGRARRSSSSHGRGAGTKAGVAAGRGAHARARRKASWRAWSDVFNAVLVKGDMLGDVVFYGKGAGKLPTASAVVADVIDALQSTARRYTTACSGRTREPLRRPLRATARRLRPCYVRVRGTAPRRCSRPCSARCEMLERPRTARPGCLRCAACSKRTLAELLRKTAAAAGRARELLSAQWLTDCERGKRYDKSQRPGHQRQHGRGLRLRWASRSRLYNTRHMEECDGVDIPATRRHRSSPPAPGQPHLPHGQGGVRRVRPPAAGAAHRAGRTPSPWPGAWAAARACIVAGILGANALLGEPLTQQDMLTLAASMEGHPDNVAPAMLGGFVASVLRRGAGLLRVQKDHRARSCAFAAFIPEFQAARPRRPARPCPKGGPRRTRCTTCPARR